jgi:hypothetical protein
MQDTTQKQMYTEKITLEDIPLSVGVTENYFLNHANSHVDQERFLVH